MDLRHEDLLRRTNMRIARLRESQRQLVQDIQERYNELGLAVGHLQSYFGSENGDEEGDPRFTSASASAKKKKESVCSSRLTDSQLNKIVRPLSAEAAIYMRDREYGMSHSKRLRLAHQKFQSQNLPDYVSQHLPALMREKELSLGTMNKVFASKWLNDSQVVLGTKCNMLMVMDVRNNNLVQIQSLRSSKDSVAADCPCGIHSIAINPSRTMLATGAYNTNDLAIYELPTFDPLCVGEQAHSDWIFDMEWVDDEHIVTGSRDSSVALWRVDSSDMPVRDDGESDVLGHSLIQPCASKPCKEAVRVRALALSRNKGLMGVLSMNAKFHYWDLETFQQTDSLDLPWKRENVCVASSDDLGLFAVGSQAYVTLIDHHQKGRAKYGWVQIPSRHGERGIPSGIRSLSFNKNIITIGTGDGRVLFYDVRMSKFLTSEEGSNCELRVGPGWLCNDLNYREHFIHGHYPNAIYTHCYDEWKARLFVAGGPLPAGLYGNYAALFY